MLAESYDYPYLTFQTTAGELTSVAVDGLSLTVDNGSIVTSTGKTFDLSSLDKMYFTSADVTAIDNVNANGNCLFIILFILFYFLLIHSYFLRIRVMPFLPLGLYDLSG